MTIILDLMRLTTLLSSFESARQLLVTKGHHQVAEKLQENSKLLGKHLMSLSSTIQQDGGLPVICWMGSIKGRHA
jgi:hypothetical protein